jgi:hypothetical protein
MIPNNRPLKAYVRYDGQGRVVSSSLILRKNKPKVGKWKEVQTYECCNSPVNLQFVIQDVELPISFDVTQVSLALGCEDGPTTPLMDLRYATYPTSSTPIITYQNAVDYLNENFGAFQGFNFLLTSPTTIEVIIDSAYLPANCQHPDSIFLNWQGEV